MNKSPFYIGADSVEHWCLRWVQKILGNHDIYWPDNISEYVGLQDVTPRIVTFREKHLQRPATKRLHSHAPNCCRINKASISLIKTRFCTAGSAEFWSLPQQIGQRRTHTILRSSRQATLQACTGLFSTFKFDVIIGEAKM